MFTARLMLRTWVNSMVEAGIITSGPLLWITSNRVLMLMGIYSRTVHIFASMFYCSSARKVRISLHLFFFQTRLTLMPLWKEHHCRTIWECRNIVRNKPPKWSVIYATLFQNAFGSRPKLACGCVIFILQNHFSM